MTAEERNMVIIERVSQLSQRYREYLKETLIENGRRGNFIRIYPTKGSEAYDKYFAQIKP
jgi:hypothetical protein